MLEIIIKRFISIHMDSALNEVVRGASTSLVIQTIGAFLGLMVSLVIARMLGAEGSGIYYFALSIVAIGSIIGRIGLDNVIVRFVASYAAQGNWAEIKYVINSAIKITFVSSLLVSAAIIIGSPYISKYIFHGQVMRIPIILSAIAVIPFSLVMVYAEALRGLTNILSSQLLKNIVVSFITLLIIYPITMRLNSNGVVVSYAVAVSLASILAWNLWRRGSKYVASSMTPVRLTGETTLRSFIISSLPLFGASLSYLIIQYSATIMLGIWGGIEDVGIFNVANSVVRLFLFPLYASISILSPKYAAMYQQGDIAGMEKLSRQSSRMLTLIMLPIAVIVILRAEWILSFFGDQFISGAVILRILVVGILGNVTTGAVAELLMMTGNGRIANHIYAVGALMVVGLNIVLMPFYGGIGAAAALSAGYVMINLLLVFYVKRTLGFWPISAGRASLH